MRVENKVALNSIALYLNMAVSMGVSLLATRFVLDALGRTDYGIYALIANIVAMFSFLNVAMAAATQRYLSYAIGAGSPDQLKRIFYSSQLIHWSIAITLVILLLSGGMMFIEQILNIPSADIGKARIVLFCMVAGIAFTVSAVPYEAAMNAHEDIFVIAGINIAETTLKLVISIAILYVPSHRLVIYSAGITGVSLFAFACKRAFSRRHYDECRQRFHRIQDYSLIKGMTSFAGWNLIGAGTSIARYQGAAILLNLFFGIAANAAYGLAQQVNGFLMFFSNSTVRPLRPQIVKSEGAGKHNTMVILSFSTCRLTFLLLSLMIIPLYINMPFILRVWLTTVPEGTLEFCRLFLLITLISQLSIGLVVALESVGRIKRLQLFVGSMHIVALPVGYLLFKKGMPASSILYCVVIEEIVGTICRTFIARRDAGIPAKSYFLHLALPCLACTLISFALSTWITSGLEESPLLRLCVSTLLSTVLLCITAYRYCLSAWEKNKIQTLLLSIRDRKL